MGRFNAGITSTYDPDIPTTTSSGKYLFNRRIIRLKACLKPSTIEWIICYFYSRMQRQCFVLVKASIQMHEGPCPTDVS